MLLFFDVCYTLVNIYNFVSSAIELTLFFSTFMRVHLSKTTGAAVLLLVLAVAWVYRKYTDIEPRLWQLEGKTMGEIAYHISYLSQKEQLRQSTVDSLLTVFNCLFSTYLSHSEISRFNAGDTLSFGSSLWTELLEESRWAYLQSEGAFDPTVGPLTEAWGFGPKRHPTIDTTEIEALLGYIGFEKLHISQKGLGKSDPRLRLDLSAIAKGYAVDLIADLLEEEVQDYVVEIGGELRVAGQRADGEAWQIGIQDPLHPTAEVAAALLQVPRGGLATSGNYRNIQKMGPHIYAHTLDPRSGRPVSSNLLSATVWSSSARRADALATACLVLGLEEAVSLISRTSKTEALFFYADSAGKLRSRLTYGLRPYLSSLRYDSLP